MTTNVISNRKMTIRRIVKKVSRLSVKPIRTESGRVFTIAGLFDRLALVSLISVMVYAFVKILGSAALLAGYVIFA